MAAQILRDYQSRGRAAIFAAWKRKARRVLGVLPTAGGKTTLFGSIAADVPCPTLILVHRRELATQAANRLREFSVPFGFIMAGEHPQPRHRVQIASVQSLVRRKPPRAGLVIADEAHLSTAATWDTVLGWYPEALVLGVTATPWRLGGKPLAGAYDESIVIATPRELREQGYLSPYVGFSYKAPDLSDVGEVGDDYDQSAAARAMSAITGDIVAEWKAHASTLSTLVFACTVEHSQKITAEFKAAGVRAEHLDGGMGRTQRDAILARVASGATQVLSNVGVVVEGLDIPRLKCIVLARPTMSLSRAIQMMGRGRRPWGGLTCRIHDHAFVITQHGLPDADRDYTLHAKKEKPPSLTRCTDCGAIYDSAAICPGCGVERAIEPAGERELKVVEDAEQFDFSSEDAQELAAIDANLPAAWKPPVKVRWDAIGREIKGIYEGAKEDNSGQYGPRVLHLVRGEKRTYALPGTVHLNAQMRAVKVDDHVIVKFSGLVNLSGGRTMNQFEVAVHDGP